MPLALLRFLREVPEFLRVARSNLMSTIKLSSRSIYSSVGWFGADELGSSSVEWMNRVLNHRFVLCLCFAVIGSISFLDAYFVAANPHILFTEQNPVCLALIKLDPDSMIYFLIVKLVGSVGVLLTLWYLQKICYRHATTVLLAIALFQVVLLTYLCLADSRVGGYPNFALLFQNTPESIFRM